MHDIYVGASSIQPTDIEPLDASYFRFPTGEDKKKTYLGEANPVCGCCGAKQATTMAQFNSVNVPTAPHFDYNVNKQVFNRGLLLMANPIKEEVLEDPRYPVVYIQCGDGVLAVRQYKER